MKDAQFHWTDACQTMFAKLKKRLSTTPILCGINWDLPFHISSYASDTAIGICWGSRKAIIRKLSITSVIIWPLLNLLHSNQEIISCCHLCHQ